MYKEDFARLLRILSTSEAASRIHKRELRYRIKYMQRTLNKVYEQRFHHIRGKRTQHR